MDWNPGDGEFRSKTVQGIGWSLSSQVVNQAIAMIAVVVLARLLSPREFGLLAMVTVVTVFAELFCDMGFSAALIQKQDITQEHLSSVFWFNLGVGVSLTAIFVGAARLLADFYGEPVLAPLTMILSANFLIGSLSIVQRTTLVKSMEFRRLAIVDIVATGLSGSIAVAMAFSGAGVWSLVGQAIVRSGTSTVLLWVLGGWRPSLIFRWRDAGELLSFSLNVFGNKILNYWVRNLDYLLIGRYIGTQPLGAYRNSYQIMLFPLISVSGVISRVMFPALSMIQNDIQRVRGAFLRSTRAIALVTFPMMTGLFVTVEPFVMTVLGPKWVQMIPILRVFCLVGLMQSIGTLNANLFLSQGRADLQFRLGLALKASSMLGIIIGLRWGVLGVAVGYSITSVMSSYPGFYFAGKLVGLTYWRLWRELSGVLACALAMAAAVWGISVLLPTRLPVQVLFASQVAGGLLVYAALVHFLGLGAYRDVRQFVSENIRHLRASRLEGETP